MTGWKKTTLTITNSIYGDQTITAYEKDGLAVGRVYPKTWSIFSTVSEMEIWYGLRAPTKAIAQERALRILTLGLDWKQSPDDEVFMSQIADAADTIRSIAMDSYPETHNEQHR